MTTTPHARHAASLVALLASYGAYHRDPRNRLTHFIGVPLITYSLLLALALVPVARFGVGFGLDRLSVVVLAAFYLYLDLELGVALTATLALLALLAEATVHAGHAGAVATAIASFIVGWGFQLLGHRLEGNQPALYDNVKQIFVAPIYLMAELGFRLGLRRSLRAQIEQRLSATPLPLKT